MYWYIFFSTSILQGFSVRAYLFSKNLKIMTFVLVFILSVTKSFGKINTITMSHNKVHFRDVPNPCILDTSYYLKQICLFKYNRLRFWNVIWNVSDFILCKVWNTLRLLLNVWFWAQVFATKLLNVVYHSTTNIRSK